MPIPLGALALASGAKTFFVRNASALIGPLVGIIRGCGDTCRQASAYADQAERTIKDASAVYFADQSRCTSDKQALLDFIDGVFQWLHRGCSAVGGDAGRRCIEERLVRGSRAPWCPTGVGCDWITLYRDPVARDNPGSCGLLGGGSGSGGVTNGGLSSLLGGDGGGDSSMLLIAAIIVVVLVKKKG